MKKIILYGTGVEGERFYWKYRDDFEIEYCIDRKCHRYFHGRWIYGIDEVRDRLKGGFVVIAAIGEAYIAIKNILMESGLQEFDDYIGANFVGRKLAILYGNCHMNVLKQYLTNNPWFEREYVVRAFTVQEVGGVLPSAIELSHCDLLVGQDIRANNKFGVPSMDAMILNTNDNCRCIKIPNLYGYNLFWPQLGSSIDYMRKHTNEEAIDIGKYSNKEQGVIKDIVARLGHLNDINIERLYHKGASIEDIVKYIVEGEPYLIEDIRKNFDIQMEKIRNREQLCDITISDYIEENYQREQLFYELYHPTEKLICEKGRRILHLLNIPLEETIPVERILDFNEIFIYGCVKSALGITFQQEFIRRGRRSTLAHRPVDLKEYVEDYIAWVCIET